MERIRTYITSAPVLPLIALFLAMGGTTYAAVALPKNSVGAAQIKTNAVRASEVRKNAIRSGEVRDGALLARDFRAGQLPTAPQGPQGLQGPQGPGGFGPNATVQFEQATIALADGATATYDVFCPGGQQGIAGAVRGDLTDSELTVVAASKPLRADGSSPTDGGGFTGWRAIVSNPPGGVPVDGDILPQVFVVCSPAP
jgi:hypothetical protein